MSTIQCTYQYKQRKAFQNIAKRLNAPYVILEISAPIDVLRQRIVARKNDVSDADLGVLEHQYSNWKALHECEINAQISVNTEVAVDIQALVNTIKKQALPSSVVDTSCE